MYYLPTQHSFSSQNWSCQWSDSTPAMSLWMHGTPRRKFQIDMDLQYLDVADGHRIWIVTGWDNCQKLTWRTMPHTSAARADAKSSSYHLCHEMDPACDPIDSKYNDAIFEQTPFEESIQLRIVWALGCGYCVVFHGRVSGRRQLTWPHTPKIALHVRHAPDCCGCLCCPIFYYPTCFSISFPLCCSSSAQGLIRRGVIPLAGLYHIYLTMVNFLRSFWRWSPTSARVVTRNFYTLTL